MKLKKRALMEMDRIIKENAESMPDPDDQQMKMKMKAEKARTDELARNKAENIKLLKKHFRPFFNLDPRPWVKDDTCPAGAAGRIGAVMFHKSLAKRLCFEMDIPVEWKWAWEERGTQIVLVELLAPLIASNTWKTFL